MELCMSTVAILAIAIGFFYMIYRDTSLFKENGIPFVSPWPIVGNMGPYFFRRQNLHHLLNNMYKKFAHARYFGFYDFQTPTILVRDPEIIHSIAIKNFDNFSDHSSFAVDNEPLMSKNLFQLRGDTWREMRKVISPTFTSSKMKMMFELVKDCSDNFSNHVARKSEKGWTCNTKDIFLRYLSDVVATTAFGVGIDSMKNPDNDFYVLSKSVMNFDGILSFKMLVGRKVPWLFKLLNIRLFADHVRTFFRDLIIETIQIRKEKGINRPDVIQLMMESQEKTQMSYDDMTSQAFIFFLAGSDSTATFTCFLAHELATNPDVQAKLREEIEESLKATNGRVTYDTVINLKYLDAVINETLRMYPLGGFVDRYCVKPYELPPATPGAKPITLAPGSTVWFLPYAMHHDPKYFPNPEKFDPSRFLDGNVEPTHYFPFGLGPRMCIGNRYALLLIKALFFNLIARCDLEVSSKTCVPMRFSKKSMIMTAENGFWLKIKARKSTSSSLGKIANGNMIDNSQRNGDICS